MDENKSQDLNNEEDVLKVLTSFTNEIEDVHIEEQDEINLEKEIINDDLGDDCLDDIEEDTLPTKKENKIVPIIGISALALCFGLIGGMIGFNMSSGKLTSMKSYKIEAVTTSDKNITTLNNVSDIVNNTMPSIVSITATSYESYDFGFSKQTIETPSSASGVIYAQADNELFIITNYHVIDGAESLSVSWFDGTTSKAEVVGSSISNEVALLKVNMNDIEPITKENIKIAVIGNSDKCTVGEGTIAIGNALGYGQTVTDGIISALNRDVYFSDGKTLNMMQTSAAINPGNSGGALLNAKGELIGINSAKYADTTVEGIGYAIPINKVIEVISNILEGKPEESTENGVKLGIVGYDITSQMSEIYNIPVGVCIQSVEDKSIASKFKLEPGDIITKVNKIPINSISQLKSMLEGLQKEDTIELTIQRPTDETYNEITIDVTF